MLRYAKLLDAHLGSHNVSLDLKIILCLGCSFTANEANVCSSDYPYHMAQVLEGEPILICNGGRAGVGTFYHLYLAKRQILKPDLVVFQFTEPRRNPQTLWEKAQSRMMTINSARDQNSRFQLHYDRTKTFWIHDSFSLEFFHDMNLIRSIKKEYDCPFIFLINNYEFPYNQGNSLSVQDKGFAKTEVGFVKNYVQKYLMTGKDDMLDTSFRGSKYWLFGRDIHPNARRARLTAYELSYLSLVMLEKT